MKTSQPPEHTSHPDDLLLPYVEDALSRGDALTVEKHLAKCPDCAGKVKGLREAIGAMRTHGEAFCPEPWELYEYVFHGEDPDGVVEKHVQTCRECESICHVWTSERGKETLPPNLWVKLKDRFHEPAQTTPGSQAQVRVLKPRFLRRFMFPSLALGAAAAAILVVFLMLPREIPQSAIATSSVSWQGTPKPKALPRSRHRTALIISLRGFPTRWPEQRIDTLYRAIRPGMDVYESFDLISPQRVTEAVHESGQPLRNTRDVVTLLGHELNVSRVAVVSIRSADGGLTVQGNLVDATSGTSLERVPETRVSTGDVESAVAQVASDLLTRNRR